MLISLEHRFTFFCTPKCASNSIEAMLKPHADIQLLGTPQLRHTDVRQYAQHIEPYLDQVAADIGGSAALERVAIVRDPVSWLYSWYRFRARSALRAEDNANSTAGVSFGEFIEAYLADTPPPFAAVGTQQDFLLQADGSLGVDRLFAYEEIDALVAWFSAGIGQELSLGAINVSPTKVYRSNLLERFGAAWRRLRAHSGKGATVGASNDGREALDPALLARLESAVARARELHSAALRGPLHKTEWDRRHSGNTPVPVSSTGSQTGNHKT